VKIHLIKDFGKNTLAPTEYPGAEYGIIAILESQARLS